MLSDEKRNGWREVTGAQAQRFGGRHDTIRQLGPRGQRQVQVDGRRSESCQLLERLGRTGQRRDGGWAALQGHPCSRSPAMGHGAGPARLSPVGVGSLPTDGGRGRLSSRRATSVCRIRRTRTSSPGEREEKQHGREWRATGR